MFHLFEKKKVGLDVSDDAIIAIADGEVIDVKEVPDPMFAEEKMGKTIAFRFPEQTVTICSPANGTLSVFFPTGHAFGISMKNGVELLVHIGVDTVALNGDGFTPLKKQGDPVKAGEPVVKVDFKKIAQTYNTSVMLIITDDNEKEISFIAPQSVQLGQKLN